MNVLTLLGIISAPLGLVLGAIAKGVYDRRTNKDTVKVQVRTGHTQEMEVAFDGLTANLNSLQEQLKIMREDVKEAKADARRNADDLYKTRGDLRLLETTVAGLRVERAAFLAHIGILEALIPDPPGAPSRPHWMVPDFLGQDPNDWKLGARHTPSDAP